MFYKSLTLITSSLILLSNAQLSVNSGKLVILNAAGISQLTKEFTSDSPSPTDLIEITPSNVLQLNFIVTDGETPIQPHQAMILWETTDKLEKLERGRDHLSTIKVRKGGKGKWEVDFSRAPVSLLAVSKGPISATLLIGSPKLSPLRIPLGTFQLSSSLALPFPFPADDTLPASWEVERYSKMPEIKWTFKEKEKKVKAPLAVLGTVFVLLPWVVIFGAASHISPSLSSPTLNILSFLLCIFSFESLIVAYWTSLTLIPTLPYFGLIGVLTAFTGRRALGDMRKNRLIREARESGKKSL